MRRILQRASEGNLIVNAANVIKEVAMPGKSKRGFASMDDSKQQEIASKGGQAGGNRRGRMNTNQTSESE